MGVERDVNTLTEEPSGRDISLLTYLSLFGRPCRSGPVRTSGVGGQCVLPLLLVSLLLLVRSPAPRLLLTVEEDLRTDHEPTPLSYHPVRVGPTPSALWEQGMGDGTTTQRTLGI